MYQLIGEGISNVGIGKTMTISQSSVEHYVRDIFAKKGLFYWDKEWNRRVQLARMKWEEDQVNEEDIDNKLKLLIRELELLRVKLADATQEE